MNGQGGRRRCVGLDVHRDFAQVAVWEAGLVRQEGRIATTPAELRIFADSLGSADEVALEATGNTWATWDAAGVAGRSGGGVEPGQDSGDRRGEGEDRQGRRADSGAAAGRGLSARGVATGRGH